MVESVAGFMPTHNFAGGTESNRNSTRRNVTLDSAKTIRVEYVRKVTGPGSDGSQTFSGWVEYAVPDEADWPSEYESSLNKLRTIMDGSASSAAGERSEPTGDPANSDQQPDTESDPASDSPDEGTQESVDGARLYPKCEVQFDPEEKEDAKGRTFARVRIKHNLLANKYKDAKSYDSNVRNDIMRLRKGDRVDILGVLEEPWLDRKQQEQQHVIAQKVTRVG